MKAFIEHESRGRLRVRMKQYRMTLEQADLLEAYLQNQPGVLNATVHERTCCAVIRYIGDRENIIRAIAQFNYTAPSVTALTPTHSGRALNREYQEKLVGKVITKFACTLFLPAPLQIARESMPVAKRPGTQVYAGTVIEEGDCVIEVTQSSGESRYDKIVSMIEQSEQLKSAAESHAANLADKLVPYTLIGSALSYALTRNVTRALSVLMVDFSCALKLAMPLAVLSAMREASMYHITVKGGKFLEAVAQADTIVFDKTGTLTHACPVVARVIPFGGRSEDDMLRVAACLEEHFPHSMANAVVRAARERNLAHEEMHSQVEYIVAHGISSMVENKKVVIGSAHFIFEDEKCTVPAGEQEKYDALPVEFSHLYLAIGGELAAVICIADPLRPEACDVMKALRALGIKRTVMLTGDSERTAAAIAAEVGVDDYRAEVLPEDKANFVEQERAAGHTVIMLGDGINDSPALSAANVGVAISDGAAIAREIADITIAAENLFELVALRRIAQGLMSRINSNYRFVIGFNGSLIGLGVAGVLAPATSAMMHNLSTLGISLRSMTNLIDSSETTRLLESK